MSKQRITNRLYVAGTVLATAVVSAASLALASDWPGYRGVNHDGKTSEAVRAPWTAGAPKPLWKISSGEGFGSFATAGEQVFFMEKRGDDEACRALNVSDGKEAWATVIDKTTHDRQGGPGPRTTPAASENKVYVMSTYLKLQCLSAADGKVIWKHDLQTEFNGQNGTSGINSWGNAASPVVVGNRVIVAGGGAGSTCIAFDKESGDVMWKVGNEKITHAAPTPATIHGVEQVIFYMQSGLVSLDVKDGRELWRFPFKFAVSTASSPIVGDDVVYCSAGYGVGGGAARISKEGNSFKVKELWKDAKLQNHWTTPVYLDGHVYGIVGFKQFKNAPLTCVEIATGKVKWEQPGFGSGGATILAGDKLIVQHDSGQITLVDPKPAAYKELGKIQPLGGKCWTMPVVANGKMFARSDKEVACLDVSPSK